MTPRTEGWEIACERDVLQVASRAHCIAATLDATPYRQHAFAAAVFECAAGLYERYGGGRIDVTVRFDPDAPMLQVRAAGHGSVARPSGSDDALLAGLLAALLGAGMTGCRIVREAQRDPAVEFEFAGSADAVHGDRRAAGVEAALEVATRADEGYAAVRRMNSTLLDVLRDTKDAREELARMRQELEETNRGVVALYAELDERADELRRADQAKTRFLSNVSHELRTPLHSIRALCGLLLDHADGPLTEAQDKQVRFIGSAADDLRLLVDELLDLAKIAAGKTDVRCTEFAIGDLFGALRGMLKPLLSDNAVHLVFEDAAELPAMTSDEAKVSQILRNLVSNALKFTEAGEVRVSATSSADGRWLRFVVADTGIGIAAEDREHIFEEFTQIANPLQVRTKGTGLGLPLCRRLAALLGGTVSVDSTPGRGSTFTVSLPRRYTPPAVSAPAADAVTPAQPNGSAAQRTAPRTSVSILVIEDDPAARYALRRRLEEAGADVTEASDGACGLRSLAKRRPDLVLLDLQLPDMSGEDVLCRLRSSPTTRTLPVAIVTSFDLDDERRSALRTLDAALVSKRDIGAHDFCERLLPLATATAQGSS